MIPRRPRLRDQSCPWRKRIRRWNVLRHFRPSHQHLLHRHPRRTRTMGSKIKPTHSLDNWGWVSTRPSILETNHSAVTPTIAASRAITIYHQCYSSSSTGSSRKTYNSGRDAHLRYFLFILFFRPSYFVGPTDFTRIVGRGCTFQITFLIDSLVPISSISNSTLNVEFLIHLILDFGWVRCWKGSLFVRV